MPAQKFKMEKNLGIKIVRNQRRFAFFELLKDLNTIFSVKIKFSLI